MSRIGRATVSLIALALVCVTAPSVQADFWAGDGLGPEGNVIKKYNTDGTDSGISAVTGMYGLQQLAYHDGYVYGISNDGDNDPGQVKRWSNADGTLDAGWSISPIGPYCIAFDSVGRLYIGSLDSDQVHRYDRETGTPDGWVSYWDQVLFQTTGIAFDASDRLYVADGSRNIVVRFNTDGTFDKIFAQSGEDYALDMCTCLAFDSAGSLYIGNWSATSIVRLSDAGDFEGTLTGPWPYMSQLGFQNDQLLCKTVGEGTYGCVPGEASEGVIPGIWFPTDDARGDYGWSRKGLAVGPVGAPTTGSIVVHVELQDFPSGDMSLVPVRIELYKGGIAVIDPIIVFLAGGTYTLPGLAADNDYSVAVSATKWLRKMESAVVTGGGTTDCYVSLMNGDLDGDNQITSTDLSIVLQHIDAIGD